MSACGRESSNASRCAFPSLCTGTGPACALRAVLPTQAHIPVTHPLPWGMEGPVGSENKIAHLCHLSSTASDKNRAELLGCEKSAFPAGQAAEDPAPGRGRGTRGCWLGGCSVWDTPAATRRGHRASWRPGQDCTGASLFEGTLAVAFTEDPQSSQRRGEGHF